MCIEPSRIVPATGIRLPACVAIAIWTGGLAARPAHGQTTTPAPGAVTLDGLLRMGPAELEAIYRQGTAVAIPEGRIRGTAIFLPGTRRPAPSRAAHGSSGKARYLSPAKPPRSTDSSECASSEARSIKAPVGSMAKRRSCSITARLRDLRNQSR